MKILTWDVETSPAVGYVWGLFDQNVGLSQIIEPSRILCFAARWEGESKVMYFSEFKDGADTKIDALWELLDQADAVVSYNGKGFDTKHANREFMERGMCPPSPYAEIDLYLTVRSRFRQLSTKLDYIVQRLEIGAKVKHEGFDLWKQCLAGDPAAWKRMETYNKGDVRLTSELYAHLRPWIRNHPNVNLHTGDEHACPTCGSKNLVRRGLKHTSVSIYQQYQCKDCLTYSRSGKRLAGTDLRQV